MKLMEWIAKQERECSEMFKLTALGAGSAFTMKNWQTNFLIETVLGGDPRYPFRMLVDCGTDIPFSLNDVDLSAKDIDAVYIRVIIVVCHHPIPIIKTRTNHSCMQRVVSALICGLIH
jgi:small ligand-binding sensory domain FIST